MSIRSQPGQAAALTFTKVHVVLFFAVISFSFLEIFYHFGSHIPSSTLIIAPFLFRLLSLGLEFLFIDSLRLFALLDFLDGRGVVFFAKVRRTTPIFSA